ncbi:MAG: histidine phosphatase family protein [Methylococcaceae bacterium]|nr:histidine phosphatase family protein [Methylococcaceae bacterium]
MSRQLLVLRHGKSDWDMDTNDLGRPLKKRGKRDAQRMGFWLQQQELIPDFIISSPAERANKTAVKLAKAMGLTTKHIHYDARIYEAGLTDLKSVLADCPESAERVLLIGHNPGLEHLIEHLHKGALQKSEDGKLLPTATLAILNMPDHWSILNAGCATVESITRPATLPKKFIFNGLAGLEQRKRPTYYYSQSAAIPYRIEKGELQILVISSSGNNHWGIPKGIIEPGYTAPASAALEAWEEAGVRGIISEHMIGHYQHKKWGGTCTVQVYPMAVTEWVDDHEWEESHRTRQWLPLKKASSVIKQKTLQAMFESLAVNLSSKKT